MRKVILENQFKRDVKKQYLELVTPAWAEVLHCLCSDIELPKKYKDHGLTGNWQGMRDCHIKPDLVLIYYKKDDDYLQLVRLGSHSELFQTPHKKEGLVHSSTGLFEVLMLPRNYAQYQPPQHRLAEQYNRFNQG